MECIDLCLPSVGVLSLDGLVDNFRTFLSAAIRSAAVKDCTASLIGTLLL